VVEYLACLANKLDSNFSTTTTKKEKKKTSMNQKKPGFVKQHQLYNSTYVKLKVQNQHDKPKSAGS
jgi:hypothetical protein